MSTAGQMDSVGLIDSNLSKAIFFENETHIGFDPNTGEPIYSGSRPRAKIGPKIDPQTGQQEVRRHATTGTPLVKVNEVKGLYDEAFIYKKVSDGHGNVYREDCEHPDVLQRRFREAEATAQAEVRGRDLLRELGASGLTAAEIRAALAARQAPANQPDQPAPTQAPAPATESAPVDDYPVEYQPGMWYLSDQHRAAVLAGDIQGFEGDAEAAIDATITIASQRDEARRALDEIPNF